MKKKEMCAALMLLVATGAYAQKTDNDMKNKVNQVEKVVVDGYKAVEKAVVNGYNAVEKSVVEGYTRVSDAFIMKFFARKGETVEQAKERMKAEEAKLREESEKRVHIHAGSHGQDLSNKK